MMWNRKRRPSPDVDRSRGSLGIGALVRVVDTEQGGERWVDSIGGSELIGVIVAPGGNQIVGYPGVGEPLSWTVAFDEPVYTEDGRGPFERATVLSRQLVPVEPERNEA
ncbi:hypothetical protein DEJ13_08755 [Curtobacterium sp. MCLR17_007]|uniref:hypothetical protein n=1 Tax=Curtobacterium sp. MCLR17_007 TaxID=2175648 RepID=UPI0011B576EF|nr:hypothetical protein [Curtobacterium sp. MCLR17_007]WIB61905.1 hypothetical protein DEJ13_08755 [Curtobacterium sp. MCLR17_007]